jgi:hypothetical protein
MPGAWAATAGVKRHYMGCEGRAANGINMVHLSYVREETGHVLAGTRQRIPAEDIKNPVESLVTGLPLDLRFRPWDRPGRLRSPRGPHRHHHARHWPGLTGAARQEKKPAAAISSCRDSLVLRGLRPASPERNVRLLPARGLSRARE